MPHYQLRTLTGGTFSAGTDWWAQFADESPTAIETMNGELCICGVTDGTAASLGLKVVNPWTMTLYIEADATHPVQMQYADQRVEYTSAAAVDIELPTGTYPIRFIRETGSIVVRGQFVGPGTSIVSLYGRGQDPTMVGSGGPTGPGDSGLSGGVGGAPFP